jgi:hypothetical protein
VGQAKRRHVLRYLAARKRAGIIGTGPFDLDETLVRLDRMLASGCRWALAVAVELARTGQLPKCKACHGYRSLLAYVQASRSVLVKPTPGPCVFCEGTGHNTSASLPWPAWLRRKGQTMTRILAVVPGLGVTPSMSERLRSKSIGGWPAENGYMKSEGWRSPEFQATCESDGKRRRDTRTRSFPRGAHENHDPWIGYDLITIRNVVRRPADLTGHLPSWFLGERRHAEQRRERARRSAGKAERARRLSHEGRWDPERTRQAMRQQAVEDLLRGSLTTARAATASDPAEQVRLAVQAAQLYAAGALGIGAASEMDRYHSSVESSLGHYGYARAREPEWRQEVHGEWIEPPPDIAVLQRGTAIMPVDGALVPVTIADGVMRLDSGQRLTLMSDGSVTANVRSWHRRLQAIGERTQPVAVHVAVERDGPTE